MGHLKLQLGQPPLSSFYKSILKDTDVSIAKTVGDGKHHAEVDLVEVEWEKDTLTDTLKALSEVSWDDIKINLEKFPLSSKYLNELDLSNFITRLNQGSTNELESCFDSGSAYCESIQFDTSFYQSLSVPCSNYYSCGSLNSWDSFFSRKISSAGQILNKYLGSTIFHEFGHSTFELWNLAWRSLNDEVVDEELLRKEFEEEKRRALKNLRHCRGRVELILSKIRVTCSTWSEANFEKGNGIVCRPLVLLN